jgi:hypothetical protein
VGFTARVGSIPTSGTTRLARSAGSLVASPTPGTASGALSERSESKGRQPLVSMSERIDSGERASDDRRRRLHRRGQREHEPRPLRVDVQAGPSGVLLDLNYLGALMELPTPNEVNSELAFDVCWEDNRVRLHGRVLRSTPCYDRQSRITWGEPASYRTAVEFFEGASPRSTALRGLVRRLKNGA